MRKFMNNVAVKYYGAIVWIAGYDFKSGTYIIEDRQGYRKSVKEDELQFLTD